MLVTHRVGVGIEGGPAVVAGLPAPVVLVPICADPAGVARSNPS